MKNHRSDRPLLRGGNFPLSFCLTFVFAMFGLMGAAAQTYTKQTVRFPRLEIETAFSGNTGTATAVIVSAFPENILVNDANSTDVQARGIDTSRRVNFDLLDPTLVSTPITAGGVTLTGYTKLAQLLRQAALDRANAAGVQ